MLLLKSFVLLATLALTLAEVVDYKICSDGSNSCEIHEVRIDPCPQAASHTACHIRRRKPATMSFDFTPSFDGETLEAGLVWVKSETQELPLITMDKDGCKYTSCPAKSGVRQTYSYEVPIESKFPLNTYTIKWTLAAPDGKRCCLTTDIKVIR